MSDFHYELERDVWANDYVLIYGEDMPEELIPRG